MGNSLWSDRRKASRRGLRRFGGALAEPLEGRVLLTVWYVDDTAPEGGDGSGWASAYRDLQSALTVAGTGDEIRVGQGTYMPSVPAGRLATFQLKTGVSLLGGYAGYGAGDPNLRNVAQYASVLSGDLGIVGYNNDNCYRVVTGSYTDCTAVLDGFVVTTGLSSPSVYGMEAGGMYNYNGSPTIRNCAFVNNKASRGGALYNTFFSRPALINCTFIKNFATWGGGMYTESDSAPTLTNCTFFGNIGIWGGGVYGSESGLPLLTNCILWENTANNGSQIYGSSSMPVVAYCDVQGGYGGAGNIDADPRFVHNPNPGPDAKWGSADDEWGDLRLLPDSPCIDAGSNLALIAAGIGTDLAGNDRFLDVPIKPDTGEGVPPVVDMGAHETLVLNLIGTSAAHDFSLGLSSDRSTLQVRSGGTIQEYAAASVMAVYFTDSTLSGTLTIDLAHGNPIPIAGVGLDKVALTLANPACTDALAVGSSDIRINGSSVFAHNVLSVLLASTSGLIQLSSLSLTDTGRLSLASNRLLHPASLALADTATLDLAGGSLLLQPGAADAGTLLSRVTELLRLGRNGGAWSGTGITSSTIPAGYTLAGVLNRQDDGTALLGEFQGQSVDANSILVTLGLAGDVNLDGKIDSVDYTRIDQGVEGGGSDYGSGDFDYSGEVDVDDYTLIDWSFLQQTPPAGKSASSAEAGPVFSEVKIESGSDMGGSLMVLEEEHGRAARATGSVAATARVVGNQPVVLGRDILDLLRTREQTA